MPIINFSGLASGIDTNALIKAQSDAARAARVEPKQERVTELEETNTALSDLKRKLSELRSSLSEFSTLAGGGISKRATSSDETILAATAANGALNGTYTINSISSRASNALFSFNNTYPAPASIINPSINNAAPAANRTITVQVGSPTVETVNVVLTNSTTLEQFITQFNQSSSKATASLINVGTVSSPQYKIFISSNATGTEDGFLSVTTGSEVGTLGGNSLSQATNAIFTIAGISGTLTRQSNSINDVIPGVTLEIQNTTSTPVTVTIVDDPARSITKVQNFVDAFNSIVKTVKEGNAVTRTEDQKGSRANFGPLAKTRVDENALATLREVAAGISAVGGSNVNIFADIGLTTERDGTLKFNSDTFRSSLNAEPSSVNSILQQFADTVASTGGTIDQYVRFNGLIDLSFNANSAQIENLNRQISDAEALITRQEEQARQRFSKFEALLGQLQSQQSQLTSALRGLN